MNNPKIEDICPICSAEILESDETIVCPRCKTRYHKDCWRKNSGCATYGCSPSNYQRNPRFTNQQQSPSRLSSTKKQTGKMLAAAAGLIFAIAAIIIGIALLQNKPTTGIISATAEAANAAAEKESVILEKMRKIIIPEIDFREAGITEIVVFLSNASREYDNPATPVEDRGVNIALDLGRQAGEIAPININDREISLLSVLEIIKTMANLEYHIRDNFVIIIPNDTKPKPKLKTNAASTTTKAHLPIYTQPEPELELKPEPELEPKPKKETLCDVFAKADDEHKGKDYHALANILNNATHRAIHAHKTKSSEYAGLLEQFGPLTSVSVLEMCVKCSATGECRTCNATGKCLDCKGAGNCASCANGKINCPDCKGTGNQDCSYCRNQKAVRCLSCNGQGQHQKNERVTCDGCNGRGSSPGLRGGPMGGSTIQCTSCRGTGTKTKIAYERCNECRGKGTVECEKCPRSHCGRCDGDGTIKCAVCDNASGHCNKCGGNGLCTNCKGEELCMECDAIGAKIVRAFVCPSKWLFAPNGIYYTDGNSISSGSSLTADKKGFVTIPNNANNSVYAGFDNSGFSSQFIIVSDSTNIRINFLFSMK